MTLKYPFILFLYLPLLWLLFQSARHSASTSSLYFPISFRNFRGRTKSDFAVIIPFLLKALGLAFLFFALARPQSSSTQTRRSSEGIDIMIALDVSQSMLIEDDPGKNRLAIAKETVMRFIKGRSDDRIGFLMFSGEAITLCPPTLDYDVLLESVAASQINLLKDGTAIGDALATAAARLRDSTAKSRVVILLTDGDNNMGAIAPLTASDIAAGYGIRVYSIALGREGEVNIPVPDGIFGKSYRRVNSTINPELLVKISESTNGKYFRAEDEESLKQVFRTIDKLERNPRETKSRVTWSEHYQIFLFIGLLALVTDAILRNTIFRILPA